MNKQIIFASLASRPVRTMVSVLAVALEVTLILVVVGLTTGISNETGRRIEGLGADIMFQPPNSSLYLALNNNTLPVAVDEKLKQVEGIAAAAPVQTLVNSQGGLDIVYGIDPDKFNAVTGGFIFIKGRMFQGSNEIVVDDWFAESKNVDVGGEVEMLNNKFKVAGIVENGKGARVFMSLATAGNLTGTDRVAMFLVKINDSKQVQAVIDRIGTAFPTYQARPIKEWASMMTNTKMPALDAFIDTVVFVAVVIGVLVIFLSMYTTITERTREIGILRSLGASKRFIVTLIFQESFVVSLIGVVLGIGSSFIIAKSVKIVFPTLVVMITNDWIVKASIFAVLSGIIGSLYPSIKAAAQDPVEALAYE